MATINSVQKSIHLPLTGLSTSRVLMCSASVGTTESVKLQLSRDVNSSSSDSNQSPNQSQLSNSVSTATTTTATSLENALNIGYPDPEMLADVLGSIQTASLKNSNCSNTSSSASSSVTTNTTTATGNCVSAASKANLSASIGNKSQVNNSNNNNNNNNNSQQQQQQQQHKITISRRNSSAPIKEQNQHGNSSSNSGGATCSGGNKISVQTVSTSTNTTNKTNSYIKNCLIRSSSCSNTNNVTSLAQIMSNNNSNNNSSIINSSNNNNTNHHSQSSNGGQNNNNSILSNSTNSNSNSNCSSNSSFSSNSSDSSISAHSLTSNGSNSKSNNSKTNNNHKTAATTGNGSNSTSAIAIVKKNRPKVSSPTRHGPQQCQTCNKIFGNASALAKHKLTHSDERKYICSMCSKAFKRQDHLNGHMMTHRNKKPYECKAEGCGKSYCDARSLRRHTENHHAGIITPQNQQTLSPAPTNTPNGLSLSPATASGDASSPDGATTCIRTYISTGGTVVDAATGKALTEEQIKAINIPIKTGVTVLSPSSSSSASAAASSSATSTTLSGTISIASSTSSTKIALTDANVESEGLTREQLSLISKIMQQTKQTSAQVTVSSATSVNSYKVDTTVGKATPNTQQHIRNNSVGVVQTRPRTWNMQMLNNSQNVAITVDEASTQASSRISVASPVETKRDDEPQPKTKQQIVATISPHLLNIVKIDQKPVECNLCHRKFKNVPALNGHMRLHGGYFKKDPETKKAEKRDSNAPPLQTASIGVRALIEEKIINKRSKDLNKGAFVVPAPPSSVANSITTTIRRSISDLENFLNHKASNNNSNNSGSNSSGTTNKQTALPSATTIKGNGGGNTLSIQQIGLPQSIEIFSTKQQKIVSNVSVGVGTNNSGLPSSTSSAASVTTMKLAAAINNAAIVRSNSTSTTTKGTSTDPKDSTLIELLKRGTRIAVTARKPHPLSSTNVITANANSSSISLGPSASNNAVATLTTASSRQIITNSNNRTVIIPSDVQVVPTKSSSKAVTTIHNSVTRSSTPANLSLPDGTPLSLTISQSSDGSADNVYTVTYSNDGDILLGENENYGVSDTEMLLQTVDSMQLLNSTGDDVKSSHSEQYTMAEADCGELEENIIKIEPDLTGVSGTDTISDLSSNGSTIDGTSMRPLGSVSGGTLPTFQEFHSKEIIMQTSSQLQQAMSSLRTNSLMLPVDLKHQLGSSINSPMHSPLAYPTPPSSHENVTQSSSPYVEEGQHYVETANAFFGEKCNTDFLTQSDGTSFFKTDSTEMSDNEKILKLKSVLEESTFDGPIKVEDLLNSNEDGNGCDLREFAETNLSFLDEDQEFLSNSHRSTSPLPESFFTTGIGSAEEVKEVLREVLPEENINLNCETQNENIIDLYYLPGLGLQSQMMPNSEDPLLSSSPREFGQQRIQQQIIQVPQQIQIQHQQQQQQQQQQLHYDQHHLDQLQLQQHDQDQHQQHAHLNATLQQQNEFVESNQIVMPLITSANGAAGQVQYTVQNGTQMNPQSQFIDATTIQSMNSIDMAMIQPIIYHGSTDKEEINLGPHLQQQQQHHDMNQLFDNAADGNIYIASEQAPATFALPSMQTTVMAAPTSMPTSVISTLQPLSNQTNSILKRRLRATGSSNDSSSSQSKYHALAPYRSKLRKPSRTHYTPAPILNPDRKGSGLYCNIRKKKKKNNGIITFDTFDEDYGDPLGLVDFSDESKVNLGSAYQAQIPACKQRNKDEEIPDTVESEQLWSPNIPIDQRLLMRYIDLSKSAAIPLGNHSEEMALHALFKADGNTATAVLTLLQTQSKAMQMQWTAEELEKFLKGLEKYGKNFTKIATKLGTKTRADCVQMYYFWKKLCVDYKVSHLKTEPNNVNQVPEIKPYVCDIPDCSASFTSKAALHGHTRIHTYGRNASNSNQQNAPNNSTSTIGQNQSQNQSQNLNQNQIPTITTIVANNTHQSINACTTQTSPINGNSTTIKEQQSAANANAKDTDYPCKVCGKVFNKVKSRSAHMKTHRVQEPDPTMSTAVVTTTGTATTNNDTTTMQSKQSQQISSQSQQSTIQTAVQQGQQPTVIKPIQQPQQQIS